MPRSSPSRPAAAPAQPDLQAFLAPDPSHPLAVDSPALPEKDRVLLTVAEARVPPGQLVQAASEMFLVGDDRWGPTLGGAVLAEDGAGPSLGGPEALLAAVDGPPATFGAHQFPLATSFSMSMSRA